MASIKDITLDRLKKFRERLLLVEQDDFVLQSARNALQAIFADIDESVERIASASHDGTDAELMQSCVLSNQKLYKISSYVDNIINSHNIGIPFEFLFGLEEISERILGQKETLVFSTDWQFSPYFIPDPPAAVSNYTFIGFPSFASRNALLLPLASHELGHAVWRTNDFGSRLYNNFELIFGEIEKEASSDIDNFLQGRVDLFAEQDRTDFIGNVLQIALEQAEEVFCDVFGICLFRESYILAFENFLIPGFGPRKFTNYPPFVARIQFMDDVAKLLDIPINDGYRVPKQELLFLSEKSRISLPLRLADELVKRSLNTLFNQANEIVGKADFSVSSKSDIERMKLSVGSGIPISNSCSIMEIINVCWSVYKNHMNISENDKSFDKYQYEVFLINICLKSLEIYEIEKRGI